MNEIIKKKLVAYFKKHKLIKFKKGRIVFSPDEEISGIVFEKSGYSRVYTVSKDGREITLPLFKPLFTVSMITALTGEKNKYYFESISPLEIWVAPKEETLNFIRSDKELFDKLSRTMWSEFMELTDSMQQLVFGDAYTKIAGLIYSMSNKFGEPNRKGVTINFNTPHRMIASMTGLTRETVTLQILKLQKEGYISAVGRRIAVKNLEKLKEIAKI
ncbi:MAG: Crp/Fnr family transcriptional regulator [Candidatus Shapirobacteria bacterium]|nr:Crp/Fnr family transcriptional regulator [Candidatus Shapirobacteria bacterium]